VEEKVTQNISCEKSVATNKQEVVVVGAHTSRQDDR